MSKEIRIPESELVALLEEVRSELAPLLAKADEEDKDKKEDKPKEDKKGVELSAEDKAPKGEVAVEDPPAVANDPVNDSAMPDPADVSPEVSAEDVAPEAEEEAEEEAEDGDIEAAPTVDELQAEYEKLSDEELAMHLMAAKAACHARNAAAAPVAPAPMPAPVSPTPALKAEDEGMKKEMKKSEDRILELEKALAEQKAKSDKQSKDLDDLVNFISKPLRKSTQFISDVINVEPPKQPLKLSKAEITAKLAKITASNELKKSDRKLVNDYYAGVAKVEELAHLLK